MLAPQRRLLELGRYDEAARAAQRQMSVRPGMGEHARGSYLRWLKGDTRNAKLLIRDALIDRSAGPRARSLDLRRSGHDLLAPGRLRGADAGPR
jgi:hypothetical protein